MPQDETKDVADMLEALARRLRSDPTFAGKARPPVTVGATELPRDEGPTMGAPDVLTDERHVTVTVETHNADPATST